MSQAEASAAAAGPASRTDRCAVAHAARAHRARRHLGRIVSFHARVGARVRRAAARRLAAGIGRAAPVADVVERPGAHHAQAHPAAHRDLGDQLRHSVRAVRMGRTARAGWHRRDHQCHGGHVHCPGRVHVLRRENQHATCDRPGRRLRRRRGTRQRQNRRRQRLERSTRRHPGCAPVWHRRQSDPPTARRHSFGHGGGCDARQRQPAARAVRDFLLAVLHRFPSIRG